MSVPAPSASPLVRRYTIDEFFALDAPPPGTGSYELIAGVLYMVPPPAFPHDGVVSLLNEIFIRYVFEHPGRCRVFVPDSAVWNREATYLQPDLFMVDAAQLATWERIGRHETAALVVEVLSPSNALYDRTAKADTYAALGVQELWLVDPLARTIEIRRRGTSGWDRCDVYAEGTPAVSTVFPGLTADPATVCPRPTGVPAS